MGSNLEPPLSDRDRELLTWLAEQRVAITPQLAALQAVSVRTARARLQPLAERKLLSHCPLFAGQPWAVLIRGRGLTAVGSPLQPPRLNSLTFRHDVSVAWLSLAARDGAFGPMREIVSEREMRSHDGRAANQQPDLKYGIGLWHAEHRRGPGSDLHYPDLRLETARGYRIAVELELSFKGRTRLREIASGYAIDRRYDHVLYLVPDRRVGTQVQAAVHWAGATNTISVQLIRGTDRVGPGAATRAPVRSRGTQRRIASKQGPAR